MCSRVHELTPDPGRRSERWAWWVAWWVACWLLLVPCATHDERRDDRGEYSEAKHVLLFIGDGMGFEQVKAAGMYANGSAGTLSFESFPHRGTVTTHAAGGDVTDSAAAATAMATGIKVANGVISVALPGDGRPLETILERLAAQGKATGLVTTTYITHATPAAFAAHAPLRLLYADIAADYLTDSRPNVLFGGAMYLTRGAALEAGYAVVTDREELAALDTEQATMVSGQFGDADLPYELDGRGDLPSLAEMTRAALAILDNDPDGFFLMVEGGRIDHAGHDNDIERTVRETLEFANAVAVALAWAQGRTDTMMFVTSDHETGGLQVLENNGTGRAPTISWAHGGHTGRVVPIYAWGVNAHLISGTVDNTDVYRLMLRSGRRE
jgi:alkaline phosphatase